MGCCLFLPEHLFCLSHCKTRWTMLAWARNSCIICKGHRTKNGLEGGFSRNYIKLYKIKMTKKLGEDQIK